MHTCIIMEENGFVKMKISKELGCVGEFSCEHVDLCKFFKTKKEKQLVSAIDLHYNRTLSEECHV